VAIGLGLSRLLKRNPQDVAAADEETLESEAIDVQPVVEAETESSEGSSFGLFFGLTLWWVLSSILALTIAGERMPWLTYHMAWPMILLAGWGIGQIIDSVALHFSKAQRIAWRCWR
jgi:hypothetical protein